MSRVEWGRGARKDLAKLDSSSRDRVIEAVAGFAVTGHGDVRRLRGEWQGHYRLRVGERRVIFTYENGRLVIRVIAVKPRGKAYR